MDEKKVVSNLIEKFKKDVLKNYRFPLFTAWISILLHYKMAYEFVKHKGLSEEFKAWSNTEGKKLVETFFKQGWEIIAKGQEKEGPLNGES